MATKLLAIGVSKDFKVWSVPTEINQAVEEGSGGLANVDPTSVSAALYQDEASGGTVPSQIILVSVEDGVPVVKATFDAGDYN